MTLKPRTALTASPSQKSQKYAVSMRVSQSGNVMAKLATCARRNKKNTGNCLCSLRRHKITATTDCRVGCAHHKERTMVWLCKVMADAAGRTRPTVTAAPRPLSHPQARCRARSTQGRRSEEHTSGLQSLRHL